MDQEETTASCRIRRWERRTPELAGSRTLSLDRQDDASDLDCARQMDRPSAMVSRIGQYLGCSEKDTLGERGLPEVALHRVEVGGNR